MTQMTSLHSTNLIILSSFLILLQRRDILPHYAQLNNKTRFHGSSPSSNQKLSRQ